VEFRIIDPQMRLNYYDRVAMYQAAIGIYVSDVNHDVCHAQLVFDQGNIAVSSAGLLTQQNGITSVLLFERDYKNFICLKINQSLRKEIENWLEEHGDQKQLKEPYPENKMVPLDNLTGKGKEKDCEDLLSATEWGNLKEVKRLIELKVNINYQNNKWLQAPLHIAAEKGYDEIVSYLIQTGASVHARNYQAETPLHLAASYAPARTSKILIDAGSEVDAINIYGCTPLHRAATFIGQEDVINLLIQNGADVNKKDDNSKTPLKWATERGNTAGINLLSNLTESEELHIVIKR
jgi:Ankyrin repeats (3 copies)